MLRVRIECGWNLSASGFCPGGNTASGFLSGVVTQRAGFCPGGKKSERVFVREGICPDTIL